MTTPYTLIERRGIWIAHAVALDLVATGNTSDIAINHLRACCIAQIGFGQANGWSLRKAYFAAPPEYWNPPFYELDFDPEEFKTRVLQLGESSRAPEGSHGV